MCSEAAAFLRDLCQVVAPPMGREKNLTESFFGLERCTAWVSRTRVRYLHIPVQAQALAVGGRAGSLPEQ